MWSDPIVEEVRALRDQYAKQFDYDLRAIQRDLKMRQLTGDRKVVRLPPRRLVRPPQQADSCSADP